MRWLLLAVPALANQLVTLAPEPQLTTSAAPAVSAASLEPSAQAASIFEPKPFWQPILPSQHIPAGLEVRMNLESGLREARLPQEDQDQSYEFSSQFEHARELAHSGDFAATDAALDDLLEFSHDYRYGYKIIGHEFPWLAQLLCDSQTPVSTKKICLSMLAACLRNNPPAVELVHQADPHFVSAVFTEMRALAQLPATSDRAVLAKRYLSVVQALAPESSSQIDQDVLLELCRWGDQHVRMKALDIAALLYRDAQPSGSQVLAKRSQDTHDVQKWVDEFSSGIQQEHVDELHIRNFFNSLYNIKQQMGRNVKVSSGFLDWLSKEAAARKESRGSGLHERDPDQLEFDRRLVESRHLVFGNPMAHRAKHFDDEL
ncbi:Nucleotide exchange factor SIL1 [Lachancea thermotolerans]